MSFMVTYSHRPYTVIYIYIYILKIIILSLYGDFFLKKKSDVHHEFDPSLFKGKLLYEIVLANSLLQYVWIPHT